MKPDSLNQTSHEKEITLLICSERPEEMEEDLSSLSEIRGYHLSRFSSETIEDAYFDTADSELALKQWALRIRTDRAGHWITLKGPSSLTEWGSLERAELEEAWSKAALEKVLTELHKAKIYPGTIAGSFEPANPLETMKSLGFLVIQSRRLERRRRGITAQTRGPEIAELAIDNVTYQFASGEILHRELEIEAKTADGSNAVKEMAQELLERYSPDLQIWPYGKLVTGRAIEQLLVAGKLSDLVDGNRLKPAAYTTIAELLGTNAPQEQKAPQ